MTEQEFHKLYHKRVYAPSHPHIGKSKYTLAHRLEAEKDLGRYLKPKEQVHHHYLANGNVLLIVCKNQRAHTFLHICEEAFRYCGNLCWRKCKFCKQYDDTKNLSVTKLHIYHKKCAAKNQENHRYGKS